MLPLLIISSVSEIKIPASGDYDQKLEAGKQVQLDVDGNSIFLLHNYYINPRIQNTIIEGDTVEVNTSHYFFHQTGQIFLQSSTDCYAHFSIYNINNYNCDEIVMSTKTRFYYEITDTIYTNGRAQFSFKNNSKVCFFTTTPHLLKYTISVNSGPSIEAYQLNGSTLNFQHSTFNDRSIFLSWHSDPSNHFTLTAIPQTPDGNQYMGDLFYYSDDQLYRGIRIYTAGNYEYNGTYPMYISVGRPGYVVMHNSQGGGLISDVHPVPYGPKSLYFAFIPQDDIYMCKSMQFVLGKSEFSSDSSPGTDKCIIAATPHNVIYQMHGGENVMTYYQSNLVDLTNHRKSPVVFKYSSSDTFKVTPIILSPQGFGDFYHGIARYENNNFDYPSVEPGVSITAYNGDYIVYMANLDKYTINFEANCYFIIETPNIVNVKVKTNTTDYGELNQSYMHGVHFISESGSLTISASYFCIFTYSIVNMATFNRPCHDIFIETGDQLRFIAAVPQSNYAAEANITLDQEQDICAWLISPSGNAEYSVSTYYLAPDKSYAEIYPVNNISGFSRVLKYAGSDFHESTVSGKSIMLYYHNELETYSDEYIKVQSKNIQHITNVSYASLAFKRNKTIRYIVPSSMGTTNSVLGDSNSMSKKKIVIMVSVLGAIAGVWVIIGVTYWITNKKRKQQMNESTANPAYPRYAADSVPQNRLEEIELSTSTSTNPAALPKAEPYAIESSDDQNNPYCDADL